MTLHQIGDTPLPESTDQRWITFTKGTGPVAQSFPVTWDAINNTKKYS